MSQDPYHDVKREVEANLARAHALFSQFSWAGPSSSTKARPTAAWAELEKAVDLLETDLIDLEDMVRVVEHTGDRWGIMSSEVQQRRAFVGDVRREISILRDRLASKPEATGSTQHTDRYRDRPSLDNTRHSADDTYEAALWEQEEQEILIARQDSTLGVISGTLSTLASQAGLIGQEVGLQSEMLDDLSTRVDTTQSRLHRVQRSLQDFIRRNEVTRSSWCIGILIVILILLLLAIILL